MMQAFVNPKPLERRSAHLACNIFNENFTDGTVMLIELISQWFKIMNMKDKNIFLRLIENLLLPCIVNYESFTKLKILELFQSCRWDGGKNWQSLQQLTLLFWQRRTLPGSEDNPRSVVVAISTLSKMWLLQEKFNTFVI